MWLHYHFICASFSGWWGFIVLWILKLCLWQPRYFVSSVTVNNCIIKNAQLQVSFLVFYATRSKCLQVEDGVVRVYAYNLFKPFNCRESQYCLLALSCSICYLLWKAHQESFCPVGESGCVQQLLWTLYNDHFSSAKTEKSFSMFCG